jgi:FixJ family two-component response regulator
MAGMEPTKRATIVVIDDDKDHLAYLAALLYRAGYDAKPFASAAAALGSSAIAAARLVITDMVMPDTDGFEVLKAVAMTRESPPVFAISGASAVRDQMLRCVVELGARMVFTKPINAEALLDSVARVIAATKSRGPAHSSETVSAARVDGSFDLFCETDC